MQICCGHEQVPERETKMKQGRNSKTKRVLRASHLRIDRCIVALLATTNLAFFGVVVGIQKTEGKATGVTNVINKTVALSPITTGKWMLTKPEESVNQAPVCSCTLEEVDTNPWDTPIGFKYQVSKNDFVHLCNLVAREYGADFVPIEEKAKVAQTVLNRVASPYFPDTVEKVITQPGQYEGELSRGYYSDRVTESVRLAVIYALNGNVQNDYVFYWGDGKENHFYTYEEYSQFATDLTAFLER